MITKQWLGHAAVAFGCVFLLSATASAVDNPTKAIPNGEKDKITGTIQGRDGDGMRVRIDDNSIVVVNLTDSTKIELKNGFLRGHKTMDPTVLVPGLRVDASGKGND